MKKYWTKKKKKNCFLLVIVAFIIPLIINEAYKIGGYVTVWDGSDMLAFYGNILTAAAAIIGVYYTLDYSKFKQMEYEKLRVKPYLQIIPSSNEVSLNNLFGIKPYGIYVCKDLNNGYTETGYGALPGEVYELSITRNFRRINYILKNSIFLNFDIRNIGADSAIKIKVILNNNTIVNGFSLSKNESKFLKMLIVFNKESAKNDKVIIGDMNIRIMYENIYGNQIYEQNDCIKGFSYTRSAHKCNYEKKSDAEVPFLSNQTEINN